MNKIFLEGLEKNNQVTLKKLTSEMIVEKVGIAKDTKGLCKGILLDLETTGLNSGDDKIIEIACREFFYDNANKFKGFGAEHSCLQDPEKTLPKEITKITGLTNNDLNGKKIDWDKINALIEGAQIIVAHNAAFDFKFLKNEPKFNANDILWGCSMTQIPWKSLGFLGQGQEILAISHGFYFDAHRALIDVDAMGYLLSHADYLATLITASGEPVIRVEAFGADFDSKDKLKRRGYRWNPKGKCWWKDEPKGKIEEVKSWLGNQVYIQKSFNTCQFTELAPNKQFE